MAEFRVEVTGLSEVAGILRVKVAELEVATRAATILAAHAAERAIKDQLRKTDHKKGTPTPSQPGSPPSLISGNLMRSIQVQPPSGAYGGAGQYWSTVGPTAIYGRIQELGGIAGRGAHLPARPYVQPALDATRAQIAEIYLASWRSVFSR